MTDHNLELMERNSLYLSGLEKGLQQGLQQGLEEKKNVAAKLLEMGLTPQQIESATGLRVESL